MSQANQQNKESLKQASQAYFEKIQLTEDELNHLETLFNDTNNHHDADAPHANTKTQKQAQNEAKNQAQASRYDKAETKTNTQRKHYWHWYGLAASFLMVVALLWQQVQPNSQRPNKPENMSYLIAKEIAKNHMELKPLEVNSGNFKKVSSYLNKLNFKPMPSNFLAKNKITRLLGARYCSIQSVTAAQMRYKNNRGKYVTFYEVGYDADKFGNLPNLDNTQEVPTIHYINGMKVIIWREKGLLMSTVVDAS